MASHFCSGQILVLSITLKPKESLVEVVLGASKRLSFSFFFLCCTVPRSDDGDVDDDDNDDNDDDNDDNAAAGYLLAVLLAQFPHKKKSRTRVRSPLEPEKR